MVYLGLLSLFLRVSSAQTIYTPDWDSLDSRPLPSWYDQSKFGIFIHWGVFSVPAFADGDGQGGNTAAEWLWWYLNQSDPTSVAWLEDNYAPGYQYQDFAGDFHAELWDPDQWAQIFADSGAKYVVLTSKHHEGFTNWQSDRSFNWNSVDIGPHRDLVADLTTAVRAKGLTMGLYYSLFEWFHPLYLEDKAANYTTSTYVDEVMLPQMKDIVNKYTPDLIWSDGDWEASDAYWKSKDFLAWLYNDSPVKDTVVVNDRWGSGDTCEHGGYYTCQDRYDPGSLQNHKWENCYTIDQGSWGFRRTANLDDYLSVPALVGALVDTVACGGNMLLNVGPTHDGRIPIVFQDRLSGIGQWLSTNGAAIYKSSPWRAQNETVGEATQVWYTLGSDQSVYATLLSWPVTEDGVLTLTIPAATATSEAYLLGVDAPLAVKPASPSGIQISLPVLSPGQLPEDAAANAWTLQLIDVE